MNRLTEKVKNTDDYIKLPTKDKQEFINKLGKIEDLMEKYEINSIEQLEEIIKENNKLKKIIDIHDKWVSDISMGGDYAMGLINEVLNDDL